LISIDTNILFAALNADSPEHSRAALFLESLQNQDDVAISEFILIELYGLLRNPTVLARPLTASRASTICESLRQHPKWQLIGFPNESRAFHNAFWPKLHKESFARRRAYDWRTALSLTQQGVSDFATVNLKDYEGFGFKRVWNPLTK
jgi:predicted nucleic acid-binding protein